MGLIRFAGDIFNQGVKGVQSAIQGKVLNPGGVIKDVVSDAAESFIPVDFDRWGSRANKATHYSQGKPVAGEVSHQVNRGINAVREPVVQAVTTEGARRAGIRGIAPAFGVAAKPLLGAATGIEVTGAGLNAVSQMATQEPAQAHALRTARAMDEGRSLGDVWQDGDWDTEMPRRWERAKEVFDPSKLEFGVTELMHGN
jgi:hypothetical protein